MQATPLYGSGGLEPTGTPEAGVRWGREEEEEEEELTEAT